jgi:hypothetical protein
MSNGSFTELMKWTGYERKRQWHIVKDTIPEFAEGLRKAMVIGLQTENRFRDFPNMKQECQLLDLKDRYLRPYETAGFNRYEKKNIG